MPPIITAGVPPARRGIDLKDLQVGDVPTLEWDAKPLAHTTAGAVAADDPAAPDDDRAVAGLAPRPDRAALRVETDIDRLTIPLDRRAERQEAIRQDALRHVLLDHQRTWVGAVDPAKPRGPKVASVGVEVDRSKLVRGAPHGRADAQIVERFGAARPDHGRARLRLGSGRPVQDAHRQAVPPQPDRQREADRAGSDDDDVRVWIPAALGLAHGMCVRRSGGFT